MKNSERLNILAYWVTQNATFERGVTVPEMVEATGISKPAIHRLLQSPGFLKAKFPNYPTGWYFDAAQANRIATSAKQAVAAQNAIKERQLSAIVNRPYNKGVDALDVFEAFEKAASKTIWEGWTQNNVIRYLEAMAALMENVGLFKDGQAVLDKELLIKAQAAAQDLLYNGETILRAVGKINAIFDNDPEWWDKL